MSYGAELYALRKVTLCFAESNSMLYGEVTACFSIVNRWKIVNSFYTLPVYSRCVNADKQGVS